MSPESPNSNLSYHPHEHTKPDGWKLKRASGWPTCSTNTALNMYEASWVARRCQTYSATVRKIARFGVLGSGTGRDAQALRHFSACGHCLSPCVFQPLSAILLYSHWLDVINNPVKRSVNETKSVISGDKAWNLIVVSRSRWGSRILVAHRAQISRPWLVLLWSEEGARGLFVWYLIRLFRSIL